MNADGSMDEGDWAKLRAERHAQFVKRQWARNNPVSVRLHKKLKAMGYQVEVPKRTNTNYHWKSHGSWAWTARMLNDQGEHTGCEIGCSDTMAACLKMSNEELNRQLD